MQTKIPEQFKDIFQEIFDDFAEFEFEFDGNILSLKLESKSIRPDSLPFNKKSIRGNLYGKVRKYTFDIGKKLVPYLEEANDRLNDIGFRCVCNVNEIVRLINKFPPQFKITICIYQLPRKNEIKGWNSFNRIFENFQKDKEDINNIFIDLFDEFPELEFEIRQVTGSTIPNLISIQSREMSRVEIISQSIGHKVKEFVEEEAFIDRMKEIGYEYQLTQVSTIQGNKICIYFQKK